ncbi:GFAP [Branchiostoma lanceolatum]|uniref:GFAP protein n=1 Tax=Branchiostoma lanceolatum TaxID=7740 RepID=A0A8J9ZF91_BRALA|nr:GFAP [Branchiostoma lanceolatum]
MSATDNTDSMEDSATSASVVTSFTSSDADDEGLGTTTYSVSTSTSDAESTASSSTVTEVRHKRYVVTSSTGRLSSIPAGDPVGPEPPSAPTADIVALNARFMYYVDRVRFLEQENRTLRHSVTELEIRSVSPEMYRTFQQEIDRGRQKVSDLNAERSHLQVEVQRLEREMRAFNYKVFEESKSRKEAVRELEKLKTELYETKKAYKDAQDNLRLKAQEQDFKTRTHEQDDISSSTCSAPGSVQGGPVPPGQEVNEVRKEVLNISLELEKLRNENTKVEIDILGTKGELQQYITGSEFEGNAQLEADVRQVEHSLTAARLQNRQVGIDILEAQEELQLYITGSEGNSQLQAEVHQVSHNASTEVTQYVSMLEKREVELETLHHSLQEQREEYEKLMHMKLDLELALKHHGLDYTTIQYDVHDWSPSHHRSSTPKGTPIRRRPLRDMDHSNKKRKTEHPSSADGSFLADEAALYVSAEGGGSASFATGQPQTRTPHADVGGASAVLGSAAEGRAGFPAPGTVGLYQADSVTLSPSDQPVGSPVSASALPVAAAVSAPALVLLPSGQYMAVDSSSGGASTTLRGTTTTVVTSTTAATSAIAVTSAISVTSAITVTSSAEVTSIPTVYSLAAAQVGTTVTSNTSSPLAPTTEAIMVAAPELAGPQRLLLPSGEYVVVDSTGKSTTVTGSIGTTVVTGTNSTVPSLVMSDVEKVSVSELVGPKRVLLPSGEYMVVDSTGGSTSLSTDYGTTVTPGTSSTASVSNVGEVEKVVESELVGPKRALLPSGEYIVVDSTGKSSTFVTNTTTGTVGGVTPVAGGTGTIASMTPVAGDTGTIGGVTPVAGGTVTIGGATPVAGGTGTIASMTPVAGGTGTIASMTPVAGDTGTIGGVTPVAGGTVTIGGVTPVAGGTGTIGGVTPDVGGTGTIGGVTPEVGGIGTIGGVTPVAGGTGTIGEVTPNVGSTGTIGGVTPVGNGTNTTIGVTLGTGTTAAVTSIVSGAGTVSGVTEVDMAGTGTTVESVTLMGKVESVPVPGLSGPERIITPSGEYTMSSPDRSGGVIDGASTTVVSAKDVGEITTAGYAAVADTNMGTAIATSTTYSTTVASTTTLGETVKVSSSVSPNEMRTVMSTNSAESRDVMPSPHFDVPDTPFHKGTPDLALSASASTVVQYPQTPQAGTVVSGSGTPGSNTGTFRIGEGYGVVTNVVRSPQTPQAGTAGPDPATQGSNTAASRIGEGYGVITSVVATEGKTVETASGQARPLEGASVRGGATADGTKIAVVAASVAGAGVQQGFNGGKQGTYSKIVTGDSLVEAPQVSGLLSADVTEPVVECMSTLSNAPGACSINIDTSNAHKVTERKRETPFAGADDTTAPGDGQADAVTDTELAGESFSSTVAVAGSYVDVDGSINAPVVSAFIEECVSGESSVLLDGACYQGVSLDRAVQAATACVHLAAVAKAGVSSFIVRPEDENLDSAHGIGDIARPGDEVPVSAYGIGDIARSDDENPDRGHDIGDIARPVDEVPDSTNGIGDNVTLYTENPDSAHGIGDIDRPKDEVPDSAYGTGDIVRSDAETFDSVYSISDIVRSDDEIPDSAHGIGDDVMPEDEVPNSAHGIGDDVMPEDESPDSAQGIGDFFRPEDENPDTAHGIGDFVRPEDEVPDSAHGIGDIVRLEDEEPDSAHDIGDDAPSTKMKDDTKNKDIAEPAPPALCPTSGVTVTLSEVSTDATSRALVVATSTDVIETKTVVPATSQAVGSEVYKSGGHSGCVISESYTIDESSSRQQTRLSQTNGTAGGGGDGQLAMAESHAVDAPGLSGPRRVLTASGEYVVASATSTVRHSGEAGDTTMGMTFDQTTTTVRDEDRPGLSGPNRVLTASGEYVIEDQTTVTTEDRSGFSGPRRVLTASGEYVVVTSSSEDQTTTSTVTTEDRPGLSGPKRVLTASGEYVIAASSEEQTTTSLVTAEDRPGLSGPKCVLTASGEYVAVTSSSEDQTTTTTVQAEDSPGLSGPKRVLTASGEYVLMSSENQTTTTTVTTEDRPGLSGPKRVLTASGEYVVMSSADQTATTVQAEDRPGLSGPNRVLTASGEYVVEDQTTTSTVTTEDRSGLSGPKRVLTASGEYVVVTSSSEHQTATTTKGGVSTEQVKRVAGARGGGTGGYLGTDDVDGTRVTSGGYVVESSAEQRVRKGGEGTQKYSMGLTETTTTKKRRSKAGKGHAEGSTSYSLHQETQTTNLKVDGSRDDVDYKQDEKVGVVGHAQLDVTNWSSVSPVFNEKTGDLATNDRATYDVAPSDVATTLVATADVSQKEDGKISGVSVTIKNDRDAQRGNSQEENVVTTHYLGNEPLVKDDFEERGMSGRKITQDRTATEAISFSGDTQMGVQMWGKFPTTQAQTVQDTLDASPTKSGWWRFFGRQSTVKTTGLTSPSLQHDVTSQRASGFQQLEPNFWGKSLGRENKRTDQDEMDASSSKSGWWRFFSRQSTTSSTTHSSQSAQRDVTSHSASGMTQLGSNSWGKTVRRETTLMRGIDETDTTTVSTSAVTSTESNVTSGSKTTAEKGAYLVDGSGKASRTCFARIGRLCVWLLPLLFLLLLLFFLLSSLLPGGMLGMFLGWERGSCHLQNSFRQSWRFMLKHRSPPPI